jgi:hypothetical protein
MLSQNTNSCVRNIVNIYSQYIARVDIDCDVDFDIVLLKFIVFIKRLYKI